MILIILLIIDYVCNLGIKQYIGNDNIIIILLIYIFFIES